MQLVRMKGLGGDLTSAGPEGLLQAASRYDTALGDHAALVAASKAVLAEHIAGMAPAEALGVIGRGTESGRDVPTPEDLVSMAELVALLAKTIEELPACERSLIVGVYFEGLNIQDAGRASGMDKSWASRIHERAIARLTKRVRAVA